MSVKNPEKRRVFAASELSRIHGNGFESTFVVRVIYELTEVDFYLVRMLRGVKRVFTGDENTHTKQLCI